MYSIVSNIVYEPFTVDSTRLDGINKETLTSSINVIYEPSMEGRYPKPDQSISDT